MSGRVAVILEKVTAMSLRIKKILEAGGAFVIQTDSEQELFKALLDTEGSPALVLLDIDITASGAAVFIADVKRRSGGAPVIVLTGGGSKGDFLGAFAKGAEDFIIKPFADQILSSRVDKYLNKDAHPVYETVIQSLDRCIAGELRKAEKGKYPISLMFLSVRHAAGKNDPEINKYIYGGFQKLFWSTDLFIHFGAGYYFGIFPFCDEKNTAVVDAKLASGLGEMKKAMEEIASYNMTSIFVSYPYDSPKTAKVFGVLKERVLEVFGELKIEGFRV
jgi:FixJ family two-component response regulator